MSIPSKDEIRASLPRCPVCEAPPSYASILQMEEVPGPRTEGIDWRSRLVFKCGAELQWDYRVPVGDEELPRKANDPLPWRWRVARGCRKQMEEKLKP